MASTAEIGKQAPREILGNWQQGTANRESGQIKSFFTEFRRSV
jgi:hypothetical protein